VAGVLPHNHRTVLGFGLSPDLYIPASRETDIVALIARLPEGMSRQGAYARLIAACKRLDKVYPPGWGPGSSWANNVEVVPVAGIERLKSLNLIPFTAFFGMLMVVVGLVLLIACANVSSLLLARASARQSELAIRLAIGAGRGRIVRQLLAESLLLALLGTAAGVLLNFWVSGAMNRLQLPVPVPIQLLIQPDWRLLLYSTAVAFCSALMAGLMPALRATRGGVSAAMKSTERQVGGRWTLRNALVVGQLAVSVVLLTTGFLFVRNMTKTMTMSPGFDADHAVWGLMRLVPENYTSEDKMQGLARRAIEELRALPGVERASITQVVPFNNNSIWGAKFRTDLNDQPVLVRMNSNHVAPDYFQTMGIPMLEGRDFTPSDRKGSPEVAILNQNLARQLFGDRNPVGHRFWNTEPQREPPVTVVAVVKNSKYFTLGEENQQAVYMPYFQGGTREEINFMVRAARPRDVVKEIARTLGRLDASAAIEVKPMRDAMGFAFLPSRIGAALLGAMGLLGLALASMGLYGVLAYSVARRTREIGLRIALGADRGAVARMVLRQSLVLVIVGISIGLGIAAFATRPLAMFLVPELSPTDPAAFLGVVAVLLAVALAATLGPALRAVRVDPMTALRYE
jgi:predicted permease